MHCTHIYDGSRKSPKTAKMLFSNDGSGRTAWSDPATRDSNCSSNISRSHFRIVFGDIGLVWIWPFCTSLTCIQRAVPSVLCPKPFPGSLRMPPEVPLFEKSGLLLPPRTECARSSDDGASLIHYAFTDIMRSLVLQPPDAADKLIRNIHGSGSGFYITSIMARREVMFTANARLIWLIRISEMNIVLYHSHKMRHYTSRESIALPERAPIMNR